MLSRFNQALSSSLVAVGIASPSRQPQQRSSTSQEEENSDSIMPPKKKTKKEPVAAAKKKEEEAAKKKAEEANKKKKEEEEKKKEEEEEESEEESEEEESTDDEERGRGKRKRKSSLSGSFQPEDFTEREGLFQSARIIKGRGKKLGEIPEVKASIEKHKVSSEIMMTAHRFLFSMRGKPAKNEIKKNILDFSGYLKVLPKNYDEKMQEKEDEDLETVYSKKAFKMTTAQLRALIDFFYIDRFTESPGGADKDTLVDYLLDFLGAPDPDLVVKPDTKKGLKKKATPKKKKKKVVRRKPIGKDGEETDTEDEDEPPKKKADPFGLVKKHVKGSKPSDAALRQWVRAYVVCFDMDTATTKHAIKSASERFGLDLSKKKATIKLFLTEEM